MSTSLGTSGDCHCVTIRPTPYYSSEEKAIIVYFASRRIYPKTLYYLLLRRGFDRSINAIERRVINIAQKYPYLKSQNNWDLEAVDRWIDDLLGDHESVNRLILFSPEDAEDVALVSYPL